MTARVGVNLSRSAPGALKLLNPAALSRSDSSSSLVTNDSTVLNPTTTPFGAGLYFVTIVRESANLTK